PLERPPHAPGHGGRRAGGGHHPSRAAVRGAGPRPGRPRPAAHAAGPHRQNATPVLVGLAEAAQWDGRPAAARGAAAHALGLLAGSDEPYWPPELCRTGMAVAATLAEQARDRHTEAEERAARELADTLLERAG